MSGICGIVNLDRSGADVRLLRRLTDFMAYRGPDAQAIWAEGHVGFGHAMLCTTEESEREKQPFSLDGEVWITADARVDGRKDLIRELEAAGRTDIESPTDVELLLHAYHAWGERCVEHLIGDFALAVWDRPRQRLFCARDHLGVKPLYYAQIGRSLVVSNTIDCLRRYPGITDDLNDHAIGDFLLADMNLNPATSVFAAVQRIPAAHALLWSGGQLAVRRYWTLPIDPPTRYRRADDYVDHFGELLQAAVEDRLRTKRVSVFMSGGLDSSAVAVTARETLARRGQPFDLTTSTVVYDSLMPDQERYYAALVARRLGRPTRYLVADAYKLYERWDHPALQRPEPFHGPLAALSVDQYRDIAPHGRVALTGHGGDPLLAPSPIYLRRRVTGLGWGELAKATWQYALYRGTLRGCGLRSALRESATTRATPTVDALPRWLQEDFVARASLAERRLELGRQAHPIHPYRPEAFAYLESTFWQALFEEFDPGYSGFQLELRHPLFDIRLVRYGLSVPSLPWCADKTLLRRAMRRKLPNAIVRRPKSPLVCDPVVTLLRNEQSSWIDRFSPTPQLSEYVRTSAIPKVTGEGKPAMDCWVNLRPLSLNCWLTNSVAVPLPKSPLMSTEKCLSSSGVNNE